MRPCVSSKFVRPSASSSRSSSERQPSLSRSSSELASDRLGGRRRPPTVDVAAGRTVRDADQVVPVGTSRRSRSCAPVTGRSRCDPAQVEELPSCLAYAGGRRARGAAAGAVAGAQRVLLAVGVAQASSVARQRRRLGRAVRYFQRPVLLRRASGRRRRSRCRRPCRAGSGTGACPGTAGSSFGCLVLVVVEVAAPTVLVAVLDAVAVGVGLAGVEAERRSRASSSSRSRCRRRRRSPVWAPSPSQSPVGRRPSRAVLDAGGAGGGSGPVMRGDFAGRREALAEALGEDAQAEARRHARRAVDRRATSALRGHA